MGAGDPYFSAYYPSCYSVFGFYGDMVGVEAGTEISYLVIGYFSQEASEPFYGATKQDFSGRLKKLGLTVSEDGFWTDHCLLFLQVWGI